jgi:hypothetical protein
LREDVVVQRQNLRIRFGELTRGHTGTSLSYFKYSARRARSFLGVTCA